MYDSIINIYGWDVPIQVYSSDLLTATVTLHFGPSDNFCYLCHTKNLVDDDSDNDDTDGVWLDVGKYS